MTQVLSLMAIHSNERSLFRLSEWKKNIYTQVTLNQVAYTCGIADQKSRTSIHALSCMKKRVHVGKIIFGSMVFGPMVLDLGIASEISNPGIGSLALVLYGFGPWFE